MNRLFLCLINVALATSFVGCVSLTSFFMTEKKCKEMNAHEYGRKTALQQMCLNTFNTYKEKCAKKYQINLNQKEFDKGYTQGINEYGKKVALQQISVSTFNEHNYKEIYTEKKQQMSLQVEFDKGYKQGIKELCTEQGGYKFGRSGKTDRKLCPKKKQPSFLKGYKKGRAEYWQVIREEEERRRMQRERENEREEEERRRMQRERENEREEEERRRRQQREQESMQRLHESMRQRQHERLQRLHR